MSWAPSASLSFLLVPILIHEVCVCVCFLCSSLSTTDSAPALIPRRPVGYLQLSPESMDSSGCPRPLLTGITRPSGWSSLSRALPHPHALWSKQCNYVTMAGGRLSGSCLDACPGAYLDVRCYLSSWPAGFLHSPAEGGWCWAPEGLKMETRLAQPRRLSFEHGRKSG